jgi:C1A family cysteine protease
MKNYTWKNRIPAKIDLRVNDVPIFDQGSEGSCTANAGADVCDFLMKQRGIKFEGSRNFLYYVERLIDGDVEKDAGSSLQTVADALIHFGICSENLWPYKDATLFKDPSDKCWQSALKNRIKGSENLKTIRDMKECLISGNPFIFGTMIYESFENTIDGWITIPKSNEKLLGGHALVIMGYIEDKNVFIGRNSWSAAWGDKGYFYLPYEYMMNPNLCGQQIKLIL